MGQAYRDDWQLWITPSSAFKIGRKLPLSFTPKKRPDSNWSIESCTFLVDTTFFKKDADALFLASYF